MQPGIGVGKGGRGKGRKGNREEIRIAQNQKEINSCLTYLKLWPFQLKTDMQSYVLQQNAKKKKRRKRTVCAYRHYTG